MIINELDNFQPSFPSQTRYGNAPSGLSLPDSDQCLFRNVIEKYFSEDLQQPASLVQGGDDEQYQLPHDSGWEGPAFGIDIPERELVKDLHYEEVDTINSSEVRQQFPVLHQKVNGHDLVWFDNGATTQKPLRVIDGIAHFYKTDYSNIHRGAHTLAARSTDQYEGAREKVARFINAPAKENILFVRGTTEGINLIAQTFGHKFLEPGDNVIVSTLDHHANIVPWQQVCKDHKAELRAIPCDKNGDLILSELERLITPRTKFVSVGHVNNTFPDFDTFQSSHSNPI